MQWARRIDYADLLKGDARAVYQECGEEVLLALLEVFAGRSLHLRSDVVTAMQERYVRTRSGLTRKEVALRLSLSEEQVRALESGE